MHRILVSLAALLVVLAVAACGGSSGRLSKAEYAKQADAICSKYSADVQKLGQPKTLEELAAFTDKAVPLAQKVVDDSKKLKPPTSEQAAADEWAAQSQKVVDAIKNLGAAARKNDQAAAKAALAAGDAANTRSNELGRQLGMSSCTKK